MKPPWLLAFRKLSGLVRELIIAAVFQGRRQSVCAGLPAVYCFRLNRICKYVDVKWEMKTGKVTAVIISSACCCDCKGPSPVGVDGVDSLFVCVAVIHISLSASVLSPLLVVSHHTTNTHIQRLYRKTPMSTSSVDMFAHLSAATAVVPLLT